MPRWPRVYLSGPITKGDRIHNYHQSIVAHRELMRRECAVLNPIPTMLLPHAWDGELSHEDWINADLPWVECADMLLRLPGKSSGADQEWQHAIDCGVRVCSVRPDEISETAWWDLFADQVKHLVALEAA